MKSTLSEKNIIIIQIWRIVFFKEGTQRCMYLSAMLLVCAIKKSFFILIKMLTQKKYQEREKK